MVRTTLAPLLSVRDGARAVAFYQTAFGAEVIFRIEGDCGDVLAQFKLGESEFWVSDESLPHLNFSPATLGGGTVRMILTVEDPDAAFDRAIAAGAMIVWRVEDQPYGWRVGRIVDPFGHHWEIGKPLSDGS